jgi:pimeloyl-ACP methyl ester carboxylesterase
MDPFEHATDLIAQSSGPPEAPAILYIPGIHGDWTPKWRMRHVLARHHRLIEIAYPRAATDWSLDDYVTRLDRLVESLHLDNVHLLAESFGSLIGWRFACHRPERVSSLMIAGGFCCTPGRLEIAAAELALRLLPAALLDRGVDLYLRYLVRRGFPPDAFRRHEDFFPATRTRRGWRATLNRLKIIRTTDVRHRLCELRVPVFYFGGAWDRVVPVRREIATLRSLLSPEVRFRCILFPRAPHPIIPARYRQVAQLISEWVRQHEAPRTA